MQQGNESSAFVVLELNFDISIWWGCIKAGILMTKLERKHLR
jgi:hypothetical protein